MQQKCDAWREEVETLSPLRDEVAQLHQENARLQQELTHVTEDGKQKEQEKEKNTAELGGRMGGRLVNVEGESETSVQLTVCDQQKNEFRIHNQQRSEDRDSDYANDPESIELPPLPPKRSTSLKVYFCCTCTLLCVIYRMIFMILAPFVHYSQNHMIGWKLGS